MKLTYSILWFEDDESWLDSIDLEPLKSEIASWGFEPNIEIVTTPTEFRSHSPFEDFELIVIDREIDGTEDGQYFIAQLRENAVFTEVIFYTAGQSSELWEEIFNQHLEGVFVSDRGNVLNKIERVGQQTINKVLDLENMRGIVMAEVGQLDFLVDQIITLAMNKSDPEQQNSIFKRFHDSYLKQQQQITEKLAAFLANPDTAAMLALCDSNKRWHNFNRLKQLYRELMTRDGLGEYDIEVLKPRNFLAHGRPEPDGDGGYNFAYANENFPFNGTVSLGLRQTIRKYKQEFSAIIESFS